MSECERQLERVQTYDSHGNPYWNGVARSGGNAPGTGNLHRARIENGRVVDIECGQHAETWVPFTAESTPQENRRTCSKCDALTKVPGVAKVDHWSWVDLTDEYAPAEWSPKPATDGGQVEDGTERLPTLPWCRECWDRAADGTQEELDSELPDECQHCGSTEVFWI